MKARYLSAVAIAAAIATVAAGCGSSGTGKSGGDTTPNQTTGSNSASGKLTVWLQVDAQSGWEGAVTAATAKFNKKYPNVTVDVQYQQWKDHLTKFDTQLTAGTPPDVIEMGNTEMAKYMIDGAFADLTADKSKFPNSDTWLQSLADAAVLEGKTYGVPYYAGARAFIYRSDVYTAAGQDPTKAQSIADLQKQCAAVAAKATDKTASAFYIPGQYWYMAMGFVSTALGGKTPIATDDGGKWKGTLESSESQQGLQAFVDLYKACSKAPADVNEANPQQYQMMIQHKALAVYDAGWVPGSIIDPKAGDPTLKGKIGVIALPGLQAGTPMSTFLGGSDLAIPKQTKHKDWAIEWISDFTDNDAQQAFMKAGNLPNTTSLLQQASSDPKLAPYAAAAGHSWFPPTAKNWASVEKANVLPNMLTAILSGQKSIADATKAADDQINQILNSAA